MNAWFSSPFFGIALTIGAFAVGVRIQKWLKVSLANPQLIAIALIITLLSVTPLTFEDYNVGGQMVAMLLTPATAVLAISIYNQLAVLKENFLPVVVGCLSGSLTSLVSIWILSTLFGLNDTLTMSLLPKSVTTPIAVSLSEQHGGIPSITVAAVMTTGLFGMVFAPLMIRAFRVKNPIAAGVAIGTSSHAGGTIRAIEIGEIEGAMSSISIGVAGLITSFLALFL